MRPQRRLTWREFHIKVAALAGILRQRGALFPLVWGVPTGGSIVAQVLAPLINATVADEPAEGAGCLVVDDICDSGRTLERYAEEHCTAVLHVRPRTAHLPAYYVEETEEWIVYPYERTDAADRGGEEIIARWLQWIGEDPRREGLRETPARVLRAWQELCAGYTMEPKLTAFEDAADQVVVSRGIAFASLCEHHLLPFFGRVDIGYLPNGRILGLSKLSRVVDLYARRLQVQERMTQQIAEAIDRAVSPLGVGVVARGTHLCMMARGVRQQGSEMVTSCMLGRFREEAAARAELLTLLSV